MVFQSATANAGFLIVKFLTTDEVCDAFSFIIKDMQQAIPGLEDFSFSYGVQEGCFTHIHRYLHSSSKIKEASVQGRFSNAGIPPVTTRWTSVRPCKNHD